MDAPKPPTDSSGATGEPMGTLVLQNAGALALSTSLEGPPPRLALLWGEEGIGRATSEIATAVVLRGGAIRLVEGANRFDPYAVARTARLRGVDPRALLRRIALARAFTAHQLVTMIEGIEVPAGGCVVVTGVVGLFSDEHIPPEEIRRLFPRALDALARLVAEGVPVLVVEPMGEVNPDRIDLLRTLYRRASLAVEITGPAEGGTLPLRLHKRVPESPERLFAPRRPLPWAAR